MAPKYPKACAGCRVALSGKDFLQCRACSNTHICLVCANISQKHYLSFYSASSKEKKPWLCPGCKAKQPKGDNTMTPTRYTELHGEEPLDNTPQPHQIAHQHTAEYLDDDSNVTQRNKQKLSSRNTESLVEIDDSLQRLIQGIIRSELAPIKSQLLVLQESVDYVSSQYDDILKTTNTLVKDYKALQTECTGLQSTVAALSDRLNIMEQQQRDNNIEIQGVPQHKTENVVDIVKKIADVVSFKICDTDILNCTRVASINKDSKRPKAIVTKLRSTRCRDEFISAVSRYNKFHPNNKLCSSLLGLTGDNSSVYVSEHLSPVNKALHAAVRARAKDLSYKFVWVRGGRIFMRKNETSPFIHIKNEHVLRGVN